MDMEKLCNPNKKVCKKIGNLAIAKFPTVMIACNTDVTILYVFMKSPIKSGIFERFSVIFATRKVFSHISP